MKKTFFYTTLLLISLFTVSCSNEENQVTLSKNTIENTNGALNFDSQQTLDSTLNLLNKMSSKEKAQFLAAYNIKTQSVIMDNADSELDSLIAASKNKVEFGKVYNKYKEKYNSIFTFNTADTTFLSPCSKLVDSRYAPIANSKGEYMIAGKVFSANALTQTYNGLQKAQSTTTNVNYAFSEQSNRRVYMHVYVVGYRTGDGGAGSRLLGAVVIYADLEATKKGIFGWVRYSTVYNISYAVNKETMRGNELGPVSKPYPKNATMTIEAEGKQITVKLGSTSVLESAWPLNPIYSPIRGTASIYSRGIEASLAGKTSLAWD